jgi:hypothetical protein
MLTNTCPAPSEAGNSSLPPPIGRDVENADGLGRSPQRQHAQRGPRHHHHHVPIAGVLKLRDFAGLDVEHVGDAVRARAVDAAVLGIGHDIVPAAVGHLDPVDDLVARVCRRRGRGKSSQGYGNEEQACHGIILPDGFL